MYIRNKVDDHSPITSGFNLSVPNQFAHNNTVKRVRVRVGEDEGE